MSILTYDYLKLTNFHEPNFELRNNNYIRYKTNIVLPNIKENELTKLYYSIGEVAEMFNVNTSLIRFWEKEFTSVKPKKQQRKQVVYSKGDSQNPNYIPIGKRKGIHT